MTVGEVPCSRNSLALSMQRLGGDLNCIIMPNIRKYNSTRRIYVMQTTQNSCFGDTQIPLNQKNTPYFTHLLTNSIEWSSTAKRLLFLYSYMNTSMQKKYLTQGVVVKTGQGTWTRAIKGNLNNKLTAAGDKQCTLATATSNTGSHALTTDNKAAGTHSNEKRGSCV